MLGRWTPEMIRFMRDASEYGAYNEALAGIIRPGLHKNAHVCDAGCGLGYLSLALSGDVTRVTAVDIHMGALGVLRENCRRRGADNVEIRCGAVEALAPAEAYDAMVFCLFGGIDGILETAARQCRGPVFIVKRNSKNHSFSVGCHPRRADGYSDVRRKLDALGVPHGGRTFSLELGQPFRSLADARLFFATYSRDADKSIITDAFLRRRMTVTGRADFPLYMPYRRELGLIVLPAPALRETFARLPASVRSGCGTD